MLPPSEDLVPPILGILDPAGERVCVMVACQCNNWSQSGEGESAGLLAVGVNRAARKGFLNTGFMFKMSDQSGP